MKITNAQVDTLLNDETPINLMAASRATGLDYAVLTAWQNKGLIPRVDSPIGVLKRWTTHIGLKTYIESRKRFYDPATAVERVRVKNIRHRLNYRKRNDLAAKAEALLAKGRRKGTLQSGPCAICGKAKTEAHHDDYAKPLEIRWLCRKHHLDWHRHNKAKNRSSNESEQPTE